MDDFDAAVALGEAGAELEQAAGVGGDDDVWIGGQGVVELALLQLA